MRIKYGVYAKVGDLCTGGGFDTGVDGLVAFCALPCEVGLILILSFLV